MTGAFFSDKPVYGITTSGGTDSICHAIYAYREWGRARGINSPNMVMPNTVHAAFYKAAHLFNIEIRET